MEIDHENDLLNIVYDNEYSMGSLFDHDYTYTVPKNHNKSAVKRPKPTLNCVVCGDNAFGKMDTCFQYYLV
jgi:hypothetical protein